MRQAGLVSIIINNYNYGHYLAESIDSALTQTYSAVEVMVVDDGSTDQSSEIIKGYGDRIIPLLKENGGQSSAFNTGFARSHGEIILFLDADDVLLEHTVEQLVQVFRTSAEVAKVQFRMEVIDAFGVRTGIIKPHPYLPMRSGNIREQVLRFPFDVSWMPTSANAFPAWVLDRIFPIPEVAYGAIGADWYVGHITPLFGSVHSIDMIGAYYRVHGKNQYELGMSTIDLEHIRQTIVFSETTCGYIRHFALELGLITLPQRVWSILAVSQVANRLISRKLAPKQHPIQGDTLGKLCILGIIAATRRFDVSAYARLLFAVWFVVTAGAPKPVARWLAKTMLFPEQRAHINSWLGRLHHQTPSTAVGKPL